MPLWYFDETLGMWKEEGTATLKNGVYTGTVTHFTDHNLDYYDSTGGFSSSSVSLRVVCNGIPIGGVAVSIVGDDAPGKYFVHPGGMTGPDGRIHFIRFPDNRPTLIDINSAKNNGLYFINTPKNVMVASGQALDLGDISLDSPCPASITGTLECSGTNVEGLVTVSDGKNINYVYTKTGDFGVQVPSTVQLTVDAVNANGDPANSTIVPALFSGEQRNILPISLCGSGTPNYTEINTGTVSAIAFSADGSRLAVYGASTITVYDAATGNTLSSATNTPQFSALQFSLDGSKLLATYGYFSNTGKADVYDVSSLAATVITSIPNLGNAQFYDDGSKIMGTSSIAQGKIIIFSATDGSVIKTLNPASTVKSLLSIGLIRDEDAAVYQDGQTARVWSQATDAELRNFPVVGSYYYFASSEDGHTIAAGGGGITFSCYDTKTGVKIGDLPGITSSNRDSVGTLLLTQNYAYVASSIGGAVAIKILKISDGTASVRLLSGAGNIGGMAASRNEKYLAAAQNGKVRIWKLQ
jgi:WD40 repeat protein